MNGTMGTCGNCKREWYSLQNGKRLRPVGIPTCPEGEILAVCRDCFDKLSSAEIIAIAKAKQRESENLMRAFTQREPGVSNVHMSPMEHTFVDAAIAGWVPYMKGEVLEPPFEQEAFAL